MAGQKDYTTQIIGVPHGNNYTIAQVGCLLYASREILGRFGSNIDVLSLNQYFVDHHLYVDAAPKDSILDDLDWNTLCKVDGANVSMIARGSGAPSNNNSIVKFIYVSPNTHQNTTHFCAVVDAAKGLILDSWDGVVKHWSVYGGPVEYASYDYAVKAAAQVDPHPDAPVPHTEAHVGQIVHLPAEIVSWRFYAEGGPWTVGKEIHVLCPAEFGGLDYEVLGNPAANMYIIESKMWGRGAIYAGSDTPATFSDKPAAAAPQPAAVVAPPFPVVAAIPGYPTATDAGNHTNPFTTVQPGEYSVFNTYPNRPDLINVTQNPGTPGAWINTAENVVAPPAPEPAPVAVPEPTPTAVEATSDVVDVPAAEVNETPTFDDIEKSNGFTKAIGWFRATADSEVYGKPGEQLNKGQLFHRAATFMIGDTKYAISFRSIQNRTLYGVSNDILTATQAPAQATQTAAQAAEEDDNLFEEIFKDISREGSELLGKAKTVAKAGKASHSIRSLGGIFHKKKG